MASPALQLLASAVHKQPRLVQVKDTQAREKALTAEVEAAKQQAQEAAAAAAALRAAEPSQGAVLSQANGEAFFVRVRVRSLTERAYD